MFFFHNSSFGISGIGKNHSSSIDFSLKGWKYIFWI